MNLVTICPPEQPKPPSGRVIYNGLLSGFCGNEDDFEVWKETPRQRLIFKLEPLAEAGIVVLFALGLFGSMIARWMT